MAEKKSPPTAGGVQKPVTQCIILYRKALKEYGYDEDIIDLAFKVYEVKRTQ